MQIYAAVRALARRSWRNRGTAVLRPTSNTATAIGMDVKEGERYSLCDENSDRGVEKGVERGVEMGVVTAYLKANSSCDSTAGKISASSSVAGVSIAGISGVNMGGAQGYDGGDTNRKLLRSRERRAIVVLGVIMVTFVVCWFPFFSAYLVSSVTGLHVHPKVSNTINLRCAY